MFEIADHGGPYKGRGLREGELIPTEFLTNTRENGGYRGTTEFFDSAVYYHKIVKDKEGNFYSLGSKSTGPMVSKCDEFGEVIWEYNISGDSPNDISIAYDGTIWVTTKKVFTTGGRIRQLSPNGTLLWVDNFTTLANTGSHDSILAVDKTMTNRKVIVNEYEAISIDKNGNVVVKMTLPGKVYAASINYTGDLCVLYRHPSTNKMYVSSESSVGTLRAPVDTGWYYSDMKSCYSQTGFFLLVGETRISRFAGGFGSYYFERSLYYSYTSPTSPFYNATYQLSAAFPLLTKSGNTFLAHNLYLIKIDDVLKVQFIYKRHESAIAVTHIDEDPHAGEIYIGNLKLREVFRPYLVYKGYPLGY